MTALRGDAIEPADRWKPGISLRYAEFTWAEEEGELYVDEVLQQQDVNLVESVQRGMNTPAFAEGRIVDDPEGSGLSEHGVHHFHGLVLDAYRSFIGSRNGN